MRRHHIQDHPSPDLATDLATNRGELPSVALAITRKTPPIRAPNREPVTQFTMDIKNRIVTFKRCNTRGQRTSMTNVTLLDQGLWGINALMKCRSGLSAGAGRIDIA